MSGNEPTPEAHSYGVGSAARLQLREEMPHVRLHRLLGEVEALSDLAVHETVRDQLQHLDLAGGRFLLELAQDRRSERDHGSRSTGTAACRSRLEATAVVPIAIEDLLALGCVHGSDIGLSEMTL